MIFANGMRCLNRTSVGLKQIFGLLLGLVIFWPQSNQRGIETAMNRAWGVLRTLPQSNQRGIETCYERAALRD